MSLAVIQRSNCVDSIIILRGVWSDPGDLVHNLCKPLHHLLKCPQLTLLHWQHDWWGNSNDPYRVLTKIFAARDELGMCRVHLVCPFKVSPIHPALTWAQHDRDMDVTSAHIKCHTYTSNFRNRIQNFTAGRATGNALKLVLDDHLSRGVCTSLASYVTYRKCRK